MTYARARLRIGVTGVGTIVLLSTAALLLDWPQRLQTFDSDLLALVAVLMLHALILAPFDLFGGFLLPRRFGRSDVALTRFLTGWLRGLAVQALVVLTIATCVLAAGRHAGLVAATAVFVLAMVALIAAQEQIAFGAAALTRVRRERNIVTVRSKDRGFTGGVVGLPGRERFIVPERWGTLLDPQGVQLQLGRWSSSVETRSRLIGLVLALMWNSAGFLMANTLPSANVTSVAGLTTVALGFTLWTFVGLLLLPTLSRPAVFAADRAVKARACKHDRLTETLSRLDRQQDDEPVRAPGIETIFHPIPALSRRITALSAPTGPSRGAWHAARTALFLSWAGFGFLSRAVHCNSGRAELWALLPCD